MYTPALPPLFALSDETKNQLFVDCAKNQWVSLAKFLLEEEHGVPTLKDKAQLRSQNGILNHEALWGSLVDLNNRELLSLAWSKMFNDVRKASSESPESFTRPLDFFIAEMLMMSLIKGKKESTAFLMEKILEFDAKILNPGRALGGTAQWGYEIPKNSEKDVRLVLALNPNILEKVPLLHWNPLALLKVFPHEGEPLSEEKIKERLAGKLDPGKGTMMDTSAISFVECIVRCAPIDIAKVLLRHLDADKKLLGHGYYDSTIVSKRLKSEKVSSLKSGMVIVERFFQLIDFHKKPQQQQAEIIESLGLSKENINYLLGSVDADLRAKSRSVFPHWYYQEWLVSQDLNTRPETFMSAIIQCARIDDLESLREALNLIKIHPQRAQLKEVLETCENAKVLTVMQRLIESAENGDAKKKEELIGKGVSVEGMALIQSIFEQIRPGLFLESLGKKAVVWRDKSQRAMKQSDFIGMCVLENRLDIAHWILEKNPKIDLKSARDLAKYLTLKGHEHHSKVTSGWEHLLLSKKLEEVEKKNSRSDPQESPPKPMGRRL